jgi:hypothetical protein
MRMSLAPGVAVTAVVVLAATVASVRETTAPASAARGSVTRAVASGHCSKATARRVAIRLHVGVDPVTGKTPIFHVLCGPFLGRGSHGMVASVAAPTGCGGSIGWAVFRYATGTWKLVMKRSNGAFLSKAGSNIRERVGAPSAGDPPCSPSAWKSRIWHWSGRRFKVTSWKLSRTKTVHLIYIRSPSHNLWCDVGDEDQAYCVSRNLPHSATLLRNGKVTICKGRRCVGNEKLFGSGTPVLAYGQQDVSAGYRCRSAKTGITCTQNLSGKGYGRGFMISAAGVKRVKP